MKNKNLNIRLSDSALKIIREKAKHCGVSQSMLVIIATELVKEEDITQYLLDNVNDKYEQKM